MNTLIHMSASIEGMLSQPTRNLNKVLEDDNGHLLSGREAKIFLKKQLAEGKKYLPCGDCEGFDYITGCPGHPTKPKE